MSTSIPLQIPPFHYVHIKHLTSNITRLECGPQILVKKDNEDLEKMSTKMITLGPRQFCTINNPIVTDKDGNVVTESNGAYKLKYGEVEYRLYKDYTEPFPLYPGESLESDIENLEVVEYDTALQIKARIDFEDSNGIKRLAGDEWLVEGLTTYYPRQEEEVLGEVKASCIQVNSAQKIKACMDYTDRNGVKRLAGEMWQVREVGSYMPECYSEVVETVKATPLTSETCLHLKANVDFKDIYGIERKAGRKYMITKETTSAHICDVHEKIISVTNLTILKPNQYVVIMDPWCTTSHRNLQGQMKITKGPYAFFLHPGEYLRNGIENKLILTDSDSVLVYAVEEFYSNTIKDKELRKTIQDLYEKKKLDQLVLVRNKRNGNINCVLKTSLKNLRDNEEEYKGTEDIGFWIKDRKRIPGEKWMEYGPQAYLPPVEVGILSKTKEIPLDKNEGIYVRDNYTGIITTIRGHSYMLQPQESLWPMNIPSLVQELQSKENCNWTSDLTKMVSYPCPFNSCVQIFNYRKKTNRIVFGPELCTLDPEEVFTVNVLSGGKPKMPGRIKSLMIYLGPDFTSDLIEVETSDHCKMNIRVSYNWHFDVDRNNFDECEKIFSIRDFIGDMCTTTASKIRSAVAAVNFENFHKSSARLIRSSIFGTNSQGKINSQYRFYHNNLVMTNVDIQSVEPIDASTRECLKKTVCLAIEMTASQQEEEAIRQSNKIRQEAEGQLERLNIEYKAKAEKESIALLTQKAQSRSIMETGRANAEAKAMAQADKMQSEGKVIFSGLEAQSDEVMFQAHLQRDTELSRIELEHEQAMSKLRLEKAKIANEVEASKFEGIMQALGPKTLEAIAASGMETQVKMLEGLGLKGYLLTDGQTPINLFSAAGGLIKK